MPQYSPIGSVGNVVEGVGAGVSIVTDEGGNAVAANEGEKGLVQ